MGIFFIHQPVTPADAGALDAVVEAVRGAAMAMTVDGWPVVLLHSTYVPADQVCVSVVDAEDAATVMETLRRAGSRPARVLPALSL